VTENSRLSEDAAEASRTYPGHPVRALLAADSGEAVARLLAADVVFHSPVADYTGRDDVAYLLTTIGRVMSGIRAVHEFASRPVFATHFRGRVEEATVEGMLMQRIDANGSVTEVTLWLRPLAVLRRAVAQMRDALAREPLPSERTRPPASGAAG
jgi:hypothetical protein